MNLYWLPPGAESPAPAGLMMAIAPDARPSPILEIYREPLRPGVEAAYRSIEEDTARIAGALGCPHAYLGAESITGPKEVWWFNGYKSSAEQGQVRDAYSKNSALMTALMANSRRKAPLTLAPTEIVAAYRPEWSVGTPWILGRGRFLLIVVTAGSNSIAGTVFESPDSTRFIVRSAQTRQDIDALQALAGPASIVLAVRPSWSVPADEWIAADPSFWRDPT